MAKIIRFPKANARAPVVAPPAHAGRPPAASLPVPWRWRFLAGLDRFVWALVLLSWSLWKWPVLMDIVFQLLRTMYYWNNPRVHAGWMALLHFGLYAALAFYLFVHKPKEY